MVRPMSITTATIARTRAFAVKSAPVRAGEPPPRARDWLEETSPGSAHCLTGAQFCSPLPATLRCARCGLRPVLQCSEDDDGRYRADHHSPTRYCPTTTNKLVKRPLQLKIPPTIAEGAHIPVSTPENAAEASVVACFAPYWSTVPITFSTLSPPDNALT